MRRLAWLVVLACGCPSKTDGPTPKVDSVMPDPICVAQQDIAIVVHGSNFLPGVVGGLTSQPQIEMPTITVGDVQATNVSQCDPTGACDSTGDTLYATLPAGSLPPGTYDVSVENPNGNHSLLAGGLTIDPPPDLTTISPTFGDVGATVTVTLTGTGFRTGMTVTLEANPPVAGTNVTVSADGTSATVTFDLTGVAPGTYAITIDNLDGCTSTLANAFTVRDTTFAISGMDPPFGCMCDTTTSVTITSSAGFVSTPTAFLTPHGQTSPMFALTRVAFVDGNTITASVPTGSMPLGTYDLTVINPPSDGRTGTLANAFRVVSMPIPSIEDVVPDRGPPNTAVMLDIYGSNFRAPITVELLDRTGAVAATASTTGVTSASHATATITTPTTEDAYLVRLIDNDQMTYGTWSAFIVGSSGASGNLHTFTTSSKLNTGRRMLAGVSARDDLGNAFVYAIGGDTGGATPTVLDTVEVAELSKFGALAAWQKEKPSNNLTTTRDAPVAVAVALPGSDPFGPPAKTYVYVAGGRDAAGTVLASVERAMVLRNADAPVISSAPAAGGTLGAGTWYYKVSAICSPTDLDNKSGETLPSDEEIVTLDAAHTAVTLSWSAVVTSECTATGYKVYRTAMVNGASQQELLIKTLGNVLSYTDTGDTAGTEKPLPPGALGVWTAEAIVLGTARWGHQGAAIADGTTGLGGLYVLGGKSNATTGYLASVEYAPIDTTGHLTGVTFLTTATTVMPTATAFFSLVVETGQNVSGYTAATPRLITTGGVTASGTSNEIEESTIATGGGNGAWAPGFVNMGNPGTLLNAVGGVMSVISSDKLWTVGGARMFNNTTQVFSNVTSGADDVTFSAGKLVAPTSSAANTLPAPVCLGAPITGSGFVYFVGGSSDGTAAVDSTYQTF